MIVNQNWRNLGWRHPLWDYVRFYSVLTKKERGAQERRNWLEKLKRGELEIDSTHTLAIPKPEADLFCQYLEDQRSDFEYAMSRLRTEEQARDFCAKIGAKVSKVKTRSQDHHQSPAAMVAAVSFLAGEYCLSKNLSFSKQPDRACVWHHENQLHVTIRNLDGAIPSLDAPQMIWEIKEYWGKTGGGSKMSDAVYECALVGRELREFEERTRFGQILHVVFLDGVCQWQSRKSDLRRFINLFHQGLINHLIIGTEVETEWNALLQSAFP